MAGLEFKGEPVDPKTTLSDEEIQNASRSVMYISPELSAMIKGRKMSKSLGNSPDPLDLIAKYGADGLRHGIMSIAPKGQDIRFSEERIEQGEIFATSYGMFAGSARWRMEPFGNLTCSPSLPVSKPSS